MVEKNYQSNITDKKYKRKQGYSTGRNGSTDMFRGRRSDSIGARVAAKLDVIVPCCFFCIEDGTYVPAPNPHTYGVLCHHMHQACKMA